MPTPDLGPDKQRALTEADAAAHRFFARTDRPGWRARASSVHLVVPAPQNPTAENDF